jgi:hypothetical protein
MDCSEAGKKGGQSRSAKKVAASARNLELARRIRAQVPETEAHIAAMKENGVTDLTAERWLKDARWLLEHPTPTSERKTVVLVAQKASE